MAIPLVCKTWLAPARATVKQIKLSGKLTLKQLQYLQLVYPAVSRLCLNMSTIEWQLGDVHLLFDTVMGLEPVRIVHVAYA
ncbi:hypothetical protein WJX82_007171 [Trebouxia sp. C0006]